MMEENGASAPFQPPMNFLIHWILNSPERNADYSKEVLKNSIPDCVCDTENYAPIRLERFRVADFADL